MKYFGYWLAKKAQTIERPHILIDVWWDPMVIERKRSDLIAQQVTNTSCNTSCNRSLNTSYISIKYHHKLQRLWEKHCKTQEKTLYYGFKNYFQGVKIYFHGLIIYFQDLVINFQGLKIVFPLGIQCFLKGNKGVKGYWQQTTDNSLNVNVNDNVNDNILIL